MAASLRERPTTTRVEPLRAASPSPAATPPRSGPGFLSRLFWGSVGFGVMVTGFALMLSVFVVFLGLPLFVFGLAMVQSQLE